MNGFDAGFSDAVSAAHAIQAKQISSVELTTRVFDRIERYNPKVNAFAYQVRESALAQAERADATAPSGPLHGVPVHVKESFAVAGHPCTWGMMPFRESYASRNSAAVQKLLDAGAVLIGATNVPMGLMDYQSYNSIYGVTNNPWDLKRTPGGSSGGSAAAVAAGLGFLGVGSDIGGSIRIPAHFCGIYGHKPTLRVVNEAGHFPGGTYQESGFSTELSVAGPMARSARDLSLALDVLGGPEGPNTVAWTWKMPAPRSTSLSGLRIGYVFDDSLAPVSPELQPVFANLLDALRRSGATLKPGWPENVDPKDLYRTYLFLLGAVLYAVQPPHAQARMREGLGNPTHDMFAAGALSSHAEWMIHNLKRFSYRERWAAYFRDVDVFLSPVAFTTAFPHISDGDMASRNIDTPSGPRRYADLGKWMAAATLTGCPATVAPVGQTVSGLPVGVQIMGPMWEDATPITFAEMLAKEIGGFTAPPEFRS